MIALVLRSNGRTKWKYAKDGVSVDEIIEIAENEVMDGYAEYSCVMVDGEVYAEYEA